MLKKTITTIALLGALSTSAMADVKWEKRSLTNEEANIFYNLANKECEYTEDKLRDIVTQKQFIVESAGGTSVIHYNEKYIYLFFTSMSLCQEQMSGI